MYDGQFGRCDMCGDLPPDGASLHVDHDHATGVVRALLCPPCNLGLGQFNDEVWRMEAGISYLKRHVFKTPDDTDNGDKMVEPSQSKTVTG